MTWLPPYSPAPPTVTTWLPCSVLTFFGTSDTATLSCLGSCTCPSLSWSLAPPLHLPLAETYSYFRSSLMLLLKKTALTHPANGDPLSFFLLEACTFPSWHWQWFYISIPLLHVSLPHRRINPMKEETKLFVFLNTQPLVPCLVNSQHVAHIYRMTLRTMFCNLFETWLLKPQFFIKNILDDNPC